MKKFIIWLKNVYSGSFRLILCVRFMTENRIDKNLRKDLYNKAVMALAEELLKNGYISAKKFYREDSIADEYRLTLDKTIDLTEKQCQ